MNTRTKGKTSADVGSRQVAEIAIEQAKGNRSVTWESTGRVTGAQIVPWGVRATGPADRSPPEENSKRKRA